MQPECLDTRVGASLARSVGSAVPAAGAEQVSLLVGRDAGGCDVGVQRLGERVMARHRVLLAAFLMQPDRPAGAAWAEVLDLHLQSSIYAREAVGGVTGRFVQNRTLSRKPSEIRGFQKRPFAHGG